MVPNLIKPLLALFLFVVVMKNSEHQFAIAKSVHNIEVGEPLIRAYTPYGRPQCKQIGENCNYGVCCNNCCRKNPYGNGYDKVW